jgi:hypothetical protein
MIHSIFLSALTMTVGANAAFSSMLFDVGADPQTPSYVSVNLVGNGTAGEYVLKGERISVYPGTPFTFLGNTPAPTELFFMLNGFLYGAQVPQINGNSTYAAPILAIRGSSGDGKWTRYNGQVTHTWIPLGTGFYACQDTVAGEASTVLSWGIAGPNGELPAGCNATKVIVGSITPSC